MLRTRSTSTSRLKKALGAVKEENKELLSKLTTEERERRNVKVGLKNA